MQCIPLKLSSSFGKLLASQAGVSLTGFAINGDFSISPLLPSEKKQEKKYVFRFNCINIVLNKF